MTTTWISASCVSYPRRTGTYRIEIVNRGGLYNNYSLKTN
jgi:hypothetical protein